MVARRKRRAVGYVRVSVDDDRKISPDAQRQAIEAYVVQKGWELVDVKIERGRSAGEGKRRPRFDEARAMIAAGHADALVAYKLDRVTRSTIDFADLWRDLAAVDCEFVSLSEQFDTTTPMGRAMLQICVTFAELERAMAADRARMTHRHRRDNGGAPAGFASYGYRKTPEGQLVVEPAEAVQLRRIVDSLLDGVSLREVVRRQQAAGVPKPVYRLVDGEAAMVDGVWRFDSLRRLVSAPVIAGLRVDPGSGAHVAGTWEPIVDPDKWHRLRRVLSDPRRRVSTKREPSLLSGIVHCGRCAAPLRTHRRISKSAPDGVMRYRCVRSDSHPNACTGLSIDAAGLEAHVTSLVLDAAEGRQLPTLGNGNGDDAGAMRDALDELATAYGSGDLLFAEWQAARRPLLERIAAAERSEVRRQRDHAVTALVGAGDLRRTWDRLEVATKRAVVRQVLADVIVDPAVDRFDIVGRVRVDRAD